MQGSTSTIYIDRKSIRLKRNWDKYFKIKTDMVKWYWKCNGCGSIIIHFDNGKIKAVTEKYIKENNIDLTKAVKLTNSDHCENCYPMNKAIEYMIKAK